MISRSLPFLARTSGRYWVWRIEFIVNLWMFHTSCRPRVLSLHSCPEMFGPCFGGQVEKVNVMNICVFRHFRDEGHTRHIGSINHLSANRNDREKFKIAPSVELVGKFISSVWIRILLGLHRDHLTKSEIQLGNNQDWRSAGLVRCWQMSRWGAQQPNSLSKLEGTTALYLGDLAALPGHMDYQEWWDIGNVRHKHRRGIKQPM